MEVPCVKAYLRHVQAPKEKARKIHDEVTILRYAFWKDTSHRGKNKVFYHAGWYPTVDDLAPGPYAPLRNTAVEYYGSRLPRNTETWRVVQAQPTTWRKPAKGVLQRVQEASQVHHILPLVVLWNLAKSMLQTVQELPQAVNAQATTLVKKMKLAGFDLSDELARLVVEHYHHLDCPDCHPRSPPTYWQFHNINTQPAEARASAAVRADTAVTAAADDAARQAALLPHAELIREEEGRLMTCLIPNSQRLVLLDMLPADIATLLQMPEQERREKLTLRVQQTGHIQTELRQMFEVEWQQQQEQASNDDAAQQDDAGTQQQQQQQQQQAGNADVAQRDDVQVAQHHHQQQQPGPSARSHDITSRDAPAARPAAAAVDNTRRHVVTPAAAGFSAAAAAATATLPALQPAAAAAAAVAVAEEAAPANFSSFLRYMFSGSYWGSHSGSSRSHQQNGNPTAGEELEVSSAPSSGNSTKPGSTKVTAAAVATVSSSPRRRPGAPSFIGAAQVVNEAALIPLPQQQQQSQQQLLQQQQLNEGVRSAVPAVPAAAALPATVTPPAPVTLSVATLLTQQAFHNITQQCRSPPARQPSSKILAPLFLRDPASVESPSLQEVAKEDLKMLSAANIKQLREIKDRHPCLANILTSGKGRSKENIAADIRQKLQSMIRE